MHNTSLAGRSILLVEDEPLIALDLELSLRTAGAEVVTAGTIVAALERAERAEWSASIIDFSLSREDGGALCKLLNAKGVPFMFFSGRSTSEYADWPDVPVVQKPSSTENVMRVLADLLAKDAQ